MPTDAIASAGGVKIKSIIVGNNELFTCPGQILCALIDYDNGTANKFSVIVSKNNSGYYLSFLAISGAAITVNAASTMKARVFYIE